MKLRQKLAVVLAASMALSAVPVVTMASTSNKVIKGSTIIEKDKTTTAASLRIKFEQSATDSQEFYLELTNAEWLEGNTTDNADDNADNMSSKKLIESQGFTISADGCVWTNAAKGVTYTRQDDTTMKVVIAGPVGKDYNREEVSLPMPIKATGGEVSVTVNGEGTDGMITEGTYKVMTTGEKAASLTVDTDLETFYDNGKLTKITLKESFLNSFNQAMILKVQLNDDDYEFYSTAPTVTKKYGFGTGAVAGVQIAVDKDDKATAYVYIPAQTDKRNSIGRLEIEGLKVDNDEKDITEGKLTADIKSVKYSDLSSDVKALFTGISTSDSSYAELDKDYNNMNVAEITNYGALIEMKDSKAVDIKAGREEDVEFTVKEAVDNVFVDGRTITLSLKDTEGKDDSAFFMIPLDKYFTVSNTDDTVKYTVKSDSDLIDYVVDGDSDSKKIIESVEFVWDDEDDLKADSKWTTTYKAYKAKEIKVTLKDNVADKDANGKNLSLNTNGDKDEFKVKLPVYVPVDKQDKKTIQVIGEMRGVDEFKAADAVNVIDPFDVTFDETTLKVGLQKQKAGNITLKELDKEMLEKGKVYFNIAKGSDLVSGLVIDDEGELTVSGDLKKTDFDKKGTSDYVELKRQSKSASSLSIDNMLITVDRTVPEGYYNLEISGDAIDKYDGKYKVENYIKIGTANTQDITNANGLAAATATFTIDSTTYTVNGVDYTMDAAPYIAGAGYTMVPVRYVANAFGVGAENILFGNGTVTIFAGTRTVQLKSGSDIATVNGTPIQMATKAVIKEGRTYIPIGEVANILSISKSWDNTAKTATFSNVNVGK